jgi:hypothetical protein
MESSLFDLPKAEVAVNDLCDCHLIIWPIIGPILVKEAILLRAQDSEARRETCGERELFI